MVVAGVSAAESARNGRLALSAKLFVLTYVCIVMVLAALTGATTGISRTGQKEEETLRQNWLGKEAQWSIWRRTASSRRISSSSSVHR
jgi:hypothetical protein